MIAFKHSTVPPPPPPPPPLANCKNTTTTKLKVLKKIRSDCLQAFKVYSLPTSPHPPPTPHHPPKEKEKRKEEDQNTRKIKVRIKYFLTAFLSDDFLPSNETRQIDQLILDIWHPVNGDGLHQGKVQFISENTRQSAIYQWKHQAKCNLSVKTPGKVQFLSENTNL